MHGRSLRWPEVVTGMLRMQLATDVLMGLIGENKIREELFMELNAYANEQINSPPRPDWYERLIREASRRSGIEESVLFKSARRHVRLSDAIRYIHIGNAEHITILRDDAPREKSKLPNRRLVGSDSNA
jgi:hypothetical protein